MPVRRRRGVPCRQGVNNAEPYLCLSNTQHDVRCLSNQRNKAYQVRLLLFRPFFGVLPNDSFIIIIILAFGRERNRFDVITFLRRILRVHMFNPCVVPVLELNLGISRPEAHLHCP